MKKFLVVLCIAMLAMVGCADDDPEIQADDDGDIAAGVGDDEFTTLDSNGDSYLDVDEVAEWADQRGEFDEWDADADSELDEDEIFGNAFNLYDGDANGKISEEEWESAAETIYPERADVIVFDDVDNDGDSELDADEFREGYDFSVLGESWNVDSFDEDTFKNAYFDLYDSDGDGKVTENEWRSGSAIFGSPIE